MRDHRPSHAAVHDAPHAHPHHPLSARLARAVVFVALLVAWAALAAAGAVPGAFAAASPPVVVMTVNGAIGPASADFIVRSLERAAHERAPLAILELDTPGGLDTSMRQIIKAILASPVPVAAFVAPGGARAASAGTYIVYASHFAAMAPGTNLGAASPVQLGVGGGGGNGGGLPGGPPGAPETASGASAPHADDNESTEARKVMHDSAAYIRGLAQLRGRNAAWGERAVREAVSLSDEEARDQHVIDLIAQDPADLARRLDGRTVTTTAGTLRVATAHAPLEVVAPDWRNRFLSIVADPNVALILLTIGIYGLFFEFANPGFVLPGVAGATCLLVGLFAMQLLPVNYAGLGLVLLGLACLIAEAFLPTFGVLGFGGIVAFAIGALMLMDTGAPGYGIPIPLIAGLALGGAAFVAAASSVALRARRRPVVTGAEAMVGATGEVIDEGLHPDPRPGHAALATGWARVHGERWHVACATPLAAGSRVRVSSRSGLTLTVTPLHGAVPDKANDKGEHS
ncbi:NfeD family protein [Paraburkholderia silvatlantica]|uniref:Membrane-bound serine protease (ClpP class) n=1 Tax=Paraburkholderia silvatlantica TaxID=321895 RepID=A0ABR6FJB0_9BURK|nr:nodulation protein NfeD [Paraburkholderia silvatlantica]MBB2927520.1 membrane-bound serine protease (ClpP class) [Paraburkholderia silvatlantica]PVY36232.1 membrane-bound serine protease (ClpP class) [Paraburkholderia silvatlantica]PXW40352.1 membrane-bound serine protease (ClpP class) [Paraburkholderia silvatlantica]